MTGAIRANSERTYAVFPYVLDTAAYDCGQMLHFWRNPRAVFVGVMDESADLGAKPEVPQCQTINTETGTVELLQGLEVTQKHLIVARQMVCLLEHWDDIVILQQGDLQNSGQPLGAVVLETMFREKTMPPLKKGAATKSIYVVESEEQWSSDRPLLLDRIVKWEAGDREAHTEPFGQDALLISSREWDVQVGTLEAALSQI